MKRVGIIGGGPAGVATAIQLQRYRIPCILFERRAIGGLLRNANLVENYPGFPGGIQGARFCRILEKHLAGLEVGLQFETVQSAEFVNDRFILSTTSRNWAVSHLVIASGTKPVPLDLPGIADLTGKTVFYEVADLPGVKEGRIAIIGAGDAAFDYALQLGERNSVTVYCRSGRYRCLPLLLERARENPRIILERNHRLQGLATSRDHALRLCWETPGGEIHTRHDYLLIAIGRLPEVSFIGVSVEAHLDKLKKSGRLYMIGDVANGRCRQATIAIGEGVRAAMIIAHQEEGSR